MELRGSKCRNIKGIYNHIIEKSSETTGLYGRHIYRANSYDLAEFFATDVVYNARKSKEMPFIYYLTDGNKLLADEPDEELTRFLEYINEIGTQDGRKAGDSFKWFVEITELAFKARLKQSSILAVTKKTFDYYTE